MPDSAPQHIKPMLARAGALPGDPQNWAFEIKWDGVRVIAYLSDGQVRLQSRNGRDITRSYPELQRAPLQRRAILDGEIIATNAHHLPDFGLLQRRMHVEAPGPGLLAEVPVMVSVFDLLALDGEDLTALPYSARRARLSKLKFGGPWWVGPASDDGERLLAQTRAGSLEGIVAKRLDSPYRPGARNGAWIKLKHSRRQELVIGGWLPGEGRRKERIGALLMGHHEQGRLVFDGRVGTGFSDRTLTQLAERLAPLVRPDSPFEPKPKLPANAVYVQPRLVAEIEYSQRTKDGIMRAPSFKGLRDDKDAAEVRLEQSAPLTPGQVPQTSPGAANGQIQFRGRTLNVTNHAKVLYPQTGFTKGELIAYYAAIADTLVPHVKGRALTLKRYPNGVDQPFFYEKNSPSHRPGWIETARIGGVDYTLANEPATLVWLGNLADLELHTSLSLAAKPASPTVVAFDLDPGAPAGIIECAEVALVIRGLFEQLGLTSCVKSSGNKGLQVYVPLNDAAVSYAQTKPLARRIAELLEARLPELAIARMTKARRAGRVFVDWSQNDAHKTTVTVYSPRATATPSISTPLSWEELAGAHRRRDPLALRFTPEQVLERVASLGDLFAPVLTQQQPLPALT